MFLRVGSISRYEVCRKAGLLWLVMLMCHAPLNQVFDSPLSPQVHVLPLALGKTRRSADFTYYPNMPGNSTSRPAEKATLQRGSMDAAFFAESTEYSCQVMTLDDVIQQHGIPSIDLLKVGAIHPQHWPPCFVPPVYRHSMCVLLESD
jgi:hypothetical protein